MKRNVIGHGAKVAALSDMGIHNNKFDILDETFSNDFDPYEGISKEEMELYNSVPPCSSMTPVDVDWDVDVDEKGPFIVKGTLS